MREGLVGETVERFRPIRENEGGSVTWLRSAEPVDGERVDEVIKTGAEVGDGITGWPGPCPGRACLDDVAERTGRELRIQLPNHRVWLRALI